MEQYLFFEKDPVGNDELPLFIKDMPVNELKFDKGFFENYRIPTIWFTNGEMSCSYANRHLPIDYNDDQYVKKLIPEKYRTQIEDVFGDTVFFHFHDCYEMNYIRQGTVYYIIDQKLIRCDAGDMIIINGSIPHAWKRVGEYQTVWAKILSFVPRLMFSTKAPDDQIIQAIYAGTTYLHIRSGDACNTELRELICDVEKEYTEKRTGYKSMIYGDMHRFSVLLIRQYYQKTSGHMASSFPTDKAFERLIEHINEHYLEPMSLPDIAKFANMNKNYFCSYFKKKTGMSFHEYIRRLRIVKATDLLLHSEYNITEIIERTGFESNTSFYRAFKNLYKMSPLEFKKQYYEKRNQA